MDKSILLFCFVCVLLGVCLSQAPCDNLHPCPNFCPDEYHEQCVRKECTCPNRPCNTTSDCPTGNMQGCPPGEATCTDSHCRCTRNRT